MSDFNERFGPFYTVTSVAAWRKCDEAEVLRDIDSGALLAFEFTDGVTALPARQFNEAAEALPGLPAVTRALDDQDPVAIALFLFTAAEAFSGRTGADWLREGRLTDVLDVAEKTFRSLRS